MRINVCDSIHCGNATFLAPTYMHNKTILFFVLESFLSARLKTRTTMGNINLITHKLLDSFRRITRLVCLLCQQTQNSLLFFPPIVSIKFSTGITLNRTTTHSFTYTCPEIISLKSSKIKANFLDGACSI